MKTIVHYLLVSFTLLGIASLLPAAAFRVEFTPAEATLDCYDFAEATLQVPQPRAANPFVDVVVAGTFALQGGTPRSVEGFCDSADGRLFHIRFMPEKPGAYDYTVTYREGTFAQSFQGRFQAVDKKRRGLVRVDAEYPAHFRWEGTQERYFWNGTTAYWLAGWDESTITQIVERLDRLKVTRVRAALNGRVHDGKAWFEEVYPTTNFSFLLNPWVAKDPASVEAPGFDVTRFNVAHWQKYEHLLQEARKRDLIVSVVFYVDGSRPGVDPFGKDGMGGPDEQRYYRYAMARLAPFANVMWDLANEYRSFRDDAWAEKMGALVKQWDPYGHLTSTHGHGDFHFRTSAWADFAMYQSWDEHGGWDFMVGNLEQQKKTVRVIPQVNEEYGYEEHYPQAWGENRRAPARSAETRLRLAWEICLAGGYQTTGERADRATGGGWINGRGDDTMTMLVGYAHLYDFFTSITWWKLHPEPSLVVSLQPLAKRASEAKTAPARVLAARNDEGDLAVVYVPGGGIITLDEKQFKDGLKPMWYSPRDGGVKIPRALRPKTYRTPDANDWVLLFRTPCNCSFREFDTEFEK